MPKLQIGGVAIALALLGGTAARAQQLNSGPGIGPSLGLSAPAAPAPAPEHLLGDLFGIRPGLEAHGINLSLDWTSEVAGNVTGGPKRGATYAGQVGFGADVDWGKLAGLQGFATHLVIVNRQGSLDSSLFGDFLNPTQEIYGAGGDTVIHLVEAYGEQTLMNGRLDIAAGRLPVLDDFAASPLNCNFMNNSLCGNPKLTSSADIGLTSYPDATFGGRVRFRPTPSTYVQTGVYEVSQGLYNYQNFRTGFKFDGSQDSGVEVPVEAAYEPVIGAAKLPGHYKLGFAFDSSTDKAFIDNAAAFASMTRATGHRTEAWALADQMIVRNGPGATDGIILLAGYAHGDPSFSNYSNQFYVAALDTDFWAARPKDTIGILFNYTGISGRLGKEQALDLETGTPVVDTATGIQTHSALIEVNYDIHVATGVNFAPDFQYFFRPNAQSNTKDAAVFGFKSHVNF